MAEKEPPAVAEGSRPSFTMRMTTLGFRKMFPSVKNISCEHLEQWRKDKHKNIVYLDTRPKEEYDVSHLPDAFPVDPSQEGITLHSLGVNPNCTIVCYCSVGYRSSKFAQKLSSEYKESMSATSNNEEQLHTDSEREGCSSPQELDIYNLEGGLFQWANEGRYIVDGQGERTSFVHPFNSFWANLLNHEIRHSQT